ncbi:hemin uptake protein HemP [Paucibacter sp. TC2R-5]|uniref:hemin uptake protein HemP n=1 Tax=Paucibacter sp. TC2R-5 TaxID=2893555 RepID=UPI0021E47E0C|nr:hemin uptake protein HemP [Paucibacter sp. TC2R-5]MCV2360264.1 hemin uptake protein HemP [Paucibacter sp. TC2R-5]
MQTSTSTDKAAGAPAAANDCDPRARPTPGLTLMDSRKRISSQSLLGNETEIEIEHGQQLYRLRLTALGKLILTK